MMRIFNITLMFLVLLIPGCASLSKQECLSADWKEIGFRDGRKGYTSSSQLSNHRQACKEYGVGINTDQYRSGYDDGVKLYCRPANGRAEGEANNTYRGVCPASMEQAFLRQYDYGRELRAARTELGKVHEDIRAKEDRLRIEKNAVIRETLRAEISALDDLTRTLQRNYNSLRDNPPHSH